jgi:hypothetical protein
MKNLLFATLLASSSTFAGKCPVLKGEYHCMFSDNTYSLLKIEQKNLSQALTEYSFDFNASNTGEPDDMGWITRCADNRLRSIPQDGSMMSEIYLDQDKALTRTTNGIIVQSCPKKVN